MFLRRVRGSSMQPGLRDNDIVVGWQKKYRCNDVAVFKTTKGEAIKRITKVTKRGYYMCGDNRHDSFDSLAYGAIPKSAILGAVMFKIRFARSVPAPALAQPRLFWVLLVTAGLYILVLLAQLSSFEEFAQALYAYGLFSDKHAAFFAISIAGLELLALPALLRLALSPAMRYMSTGAIVAAPVLWFVLISAAFITGKPIQNIGLFGGIITPPVALYTVLFSGLLVYMAIASLIVLCAGRKRSKKLAR